MICPKCGKNLPEDSVFCEFCGARINETRVTERRRPKKKKFPIAIIAVIAVVIVALIIIPLKKKGNNRNTEIQGINENVMIPEKPEHHEEIETAIPEEPDMTMRDIANRLSTDDFAKAMDFDWLINNIFFDGNVAGQAISDGMQQSLNGGWKAFMMDADSGNYNPDFERYFNAEINTHDDVFDITMNWKYVFDAVAGKSIEESGNDLFKGKWNESDMTAEAQCDYAKVEFDGFYMSDDNSRQYAIGKFYWISGETYYIGLMR